MEFIAEISSNHNNDIDRSKKFIDVAKNAGCTGVKFQLFKINEMFSHEILSKSEEHQKRKNWELPEKFIPILSDHCRDNDMLFSCTPFYLDAVDILEPYVDFYKIASYELLWLDLFKKCADTQKPIVFSTGMANYQEIEKTLEFIINETICKDVTVLHCNSAYPTPLKDANLSGIKTLNEMVDSMKTTDDTRISVGYSDHTVLASVMYRAVHYFNSDFIEFHIDLDGKGEEHKFGHCWLPDQISNVIKNINEGIKADGIENLMPSPSEYPDREWRADPSDGLRPFKTIRRDFK